MKNPNRETVSKLDELPNIGKKIATLLELIGINHPKDLIGTDPMDLYESLCGVTGEKHDPCVIDTFMAAVDFMQGGEALPWWAYTEKRKNQLAKAK